jgi:hypothetical protein
MSVTADDLMRLLDIVEKLANSQTAMTSLLEQRLTLLENAHSNLAQEVSNELSGMVRDSRKTGGMGA